MRPQLLRTRPADTPAALVEPAEVLVMPSLR
jgi:hypothetical protein